MTLITTITAFLIFMLGAAVGSFLLVISHRIRYQKPGAIKGRSYCPDCKKQLKPHHLIPIFSWLLLKGKCAFCQKKIPTQYFLTELFAGLSFMILLIKFNPLITQNIETIYHLLFYLILNTFFIAIFIYDFLYREIPDRFSLPAIAIAFIGNILLDITPISDMLIGGGIILTFFLLQFTLSQGRALGGGDLRLGLLIGILLGWQLGLLALFISYLIGGTFATILLIRKSVTGTSQIAFGPFLIIGTYFTILCGPETLNWYLSILG